MYPLVKVVEGVSEVGQGIANFFERCSSSQGASDQRFEAQLKMAELPRNSNPTRIRNRCELTGRSRAVYRRFRLSRIALRDLASIGMIPGVTKSSW